MLYNRSDPSKSFDFSQFTQIKELEIKKSDLSAKEWLVITDGISRIPSESFRKLVVETSRLTLSDIEALAIILKTFTRRLRVEIRCDEFELKLIVNEQ